MKVIAMKERADGNESVGSMWIDTAVFNGADTLDTVLAWAADLNEHTADPLLSSRQSNEEGHETRTPDAISSRLDLKEQSMSTKPKATKKENGKPSNGNAETKVIEVRNAGPIKQFRMEMADGPGFYKIVAENGCGKSHFQRAFLRATGHDVDVALRDGSKELTVDFNGENLLSLKKVKATGDVEGEIWSDCPLADFILPDAADANVNERRRIEALLRLIDQEVNEDTIRTLLGGVTIDSDDNDDLQEMVEECVDNALDYVLENEGETIRQQNIVVAKERVRRRVHEIKRRMEQAGEAAQAEITARTMPKPEVVVEVGAELAQQNYELAIRRVERLSGEAEQRTQREAERVEIEATIGERPDAEAAEVRYQHAGDALDSAVKERSECDTQIRELQARLALLTRAVTDHKIKVDDAANELSRVRAQESSWDRRAEILATPVTGATPQDVERAQRDVARGRENLDHARATERWQESCRLVREAQETREKAFARAAIYEKIATGATGQLAVLLAQAGVEGLTVDEDRLCEIQPGGQLEPLSRLSEGERARIGCKILLKNQSVPYNVLVLPGRLVRSLGPKAYSEVEQELVNAGLYAIYEQPGIGDQLSAEKAIS